MGVFYAPSQAQGYRNRRVGCKPFRVADVFDEVARWGAASRLELKSDRAVAVA